MVASFMPASACSQNIRAILTIDLRIGRPKRYHISGASKSIFARKGCLTAANAKDGGAVFFLRLPAL
jgi:hypothetical protein